MAAMASTMRGTARGKHTRVMAATGLQFLHSAAVGRRTQRPHQSGHRGLEGHAKNNIGAAAYAP